MYFFYAATMAPFLVMMIAMILGDILHKPGQNAERRTLGLLVVCFYVALVITNFAWMYPILTGLPISQAHLEHADLAAVAGGSSFRRYRRCSGRYSTLHLR